MYIIVNVSLCGFYSRFRPSRIRFIIVYNNQWVKVRLLNNEKGKHVMVTTKIGSTSWNNKEG